MAADACFARSNHERGQVGVMTSQGDKHSGIPKRLVVVAMLLSLLLFATPHASAQDEDTGSSVISIEGTVRSGDLALSGVEVCAIAGTETTGCTETVEGEYQLVDLPAGIYIVQFRDLTQTFERECWNNKPRCLGADVIEYDGTSTVSGIDADLRKLSDPEEVLVASDGSPCDLVGTEGDDVITGTDQPEVICGLGGNDVINPGWGNDIIDGGAGTDRVEYTGFMWGPLTVNLQAGEGSATFHTARYFSIENVVGSDFDDIISGDGEANELDGAGGDDVIEGRQGEDLLLGGPGIDTLRGQGAADRLEGGVGDDDLDGGAGPDRLIGADGADRLVGGRGADVIEGGEGDDELFGKGGADILLGEAGDDLIEGGGGPDQIFGKDGDDLIRAGGGDDVVDAGTGDDVMQGGGGADSLIGSAGNDTFFGGNGDDECMGGAGTDKARGCEASLGNELPKVDPVPGDETSEPGDEASEPGDEASEPG